LRLHDLVQAVPGILIAVLLPGWALATLIAPRWRAWERLAAAPGLSAGFFGVLGLSLRVVHVPFEPLTVFLSIAVVAGAALFRRHLTGPSPRDDAPRWLPVPALIAGAVGAAAFAVALHGQVLPPDWDPAVHATTANGIALTHNVLPAVQIPLEGTFLTKARPGFEAMTAVVSWVGGPPPALSMAPLLTAVLVLMPLGITLLALEATGSIPLAAIAPLFAVGLAFPAFQAILGRYPQVVDSTLVVPLVIAALRLLRTPQVADNALLVGTITASIWVIHGLEALTAAVVGGSLLIAAAVVAVRASPRSALMRVGAGGLATLAGALLVTKLTRVPHAPPPIHPEVFAPLSTAASAPAHPLQLIEFITQTDLTSPVAVALLAAGVLAIVVTRRMLWVLVSEAVLLIAMADSFSWHVLARFWNHVVSPWGEPDRIVGVQYWLIPLILAAGLLAVGRVMRELSQRPRVRRAAPLAAAVLAIAVLLTQQPVASVWNRFFGLTIALPPLGTFNALASLWAWTIAIVVAAIAVVLAWLAMVAGLGGPGRIRRLVGKHGGGATAGWGALGAVAVMCVVVGASADLTVYQRGVATRGLTAPADLTVLNRMSAVLRPGTLVLTDSDVDAGKWIAGVTDLTPLVPGQYENGPLSAPLVTALANACTDPSSAEQALTRVGAVFVGAHHLLGATNTWSEACIARLPGLRLIAAEAWQGTESAAFAVDHPGG
jgi:hypothetical protein